MKECGELTLTKDNADKGFFAWLTSLSGAPLGAESGISGVFCCREKMWIVPLSLDTASQSGQSPLEKARLYMHAPSTPLLNSCRQTELATRANHMKR